MAFWKITAFDNGQPMAKVIEVGPYTGDFMYECEQQNGWFPRNTIVKMEILMAVPDSQTSHHPNQNIDA